VSEGGGMLRGEEGCVGVVNLSHFCQVSFLDFDDVCLLFSCYFAGPG
jgi:hypothetical protein